MIKHIVLIKIKNSFEALEKNQKCIELKEMLDMLPGKINEICAYETGINISKSQNAFDLVLISDFKSFETLETYRIHPEHMKVLDFINEIKEDVKVVDYEY